MDVYLKALNEADDEANTVQEAASNLQHKFQELIADDKEMHDKACKGEYKLESLRRTLQIFPWVCE